MKLIKDRTEIILPLCAGLSVLDVGCAHEGISDRWLHPKIKKVAKYLVGLDINKEMVSKLNYHGYKIVLGDCETVDLQWRFDVIVAGELIEHLSNPGLFLENMRKHLNGNGKLIITTPNRYNAVMNISCFIRNYIPHYDKPWPEHVNAFDEDTLTRLVERHGYKVRGFYYYTGGYDGLMGKTVVRLMHRLRPRFANGMIAVLERR